MKDIIKNNEKLLDNKGKWYPVYSITDELKIFDKNPITIFLSDSHHNIITFARIGKYSVSLGAFNCTHIRALTDDEIKEYCLI